MRQRQLRVWAGILLSCVLGLSVAGCGGGSPGSAGVAVGGRVTEGPGGLPVSGVNVAITHGDKGTATAVTDAAGRFSFGAVQPGEISLVASAPSRTTTRWLGRVDSGGRQDIVLYSLPLSSPSADRNPPQVTWTDADSSGRKWQLRFTDDGGLGQAEILIAGSVAVWRADLEGQTSWEGTVELPAGMWPVAEYRLVLRVTDRAAAGAAGGVSGNATVYERRVRIGPSSDPPGGSAPASAPADFRATAVSVTPAAYSWLAEDGESAAGSVQAQGQMAGRDARAAAQLIRAVAPLPAVDGKAKLQGRPAVRVQQVGTGLVYVGLRWRWPADTAQAVEGFLLRRNGGQSATVPTAVGRPDPSGVWREYSWSDSEGKLAAGDRLTYTLAAARGGASGPAATAGPVEVLPHLADPRLLSPADGRVTSSLPVLEWAGDSLAHGYIVEVLAGQSNRVIWSGFTTGTRVDLTQAAGGLPAGTYRWRVVAVAALPLFLPERTQYDAVSLAVSPVRSFTLTGGAQGAAE
ncbi:MAG: carboxypeptidase regulatory-like domain-containing protein [Limnochordales bacterium]|nr:carboxypeptidase regulatory-like domain-containing protein [Limnochordales bacterium]